MSLQRSKRFRLSLLGRQSCALSFGSSERFRAQLFLKQRAQARVGSLSHTVSAKMDAVLQIVNAPDDFCGVVIATAKSQVKGRDLQWTARNELLNGSQDEPLPQRLHGAIQITALKSEHGKSFKTSQCHMRSRSELACHHSLGELER